MIGFLWVERGLGGAGLFLKLTGEELADDRRDLGSPAFEREMAGVEEMDFGVGVVAFEGIGTGWQEERIVPAPYCEQRRPVVADVFLEFRIERDIALVV